MRYLLAAAMTLAACSPSTGPGGPPPQLTELPRALTVHEARVSRAANQFALDLFKRLNAAQPGENVFVSPLSVSFSLGMTMNGADGTTLDEMRSTLGFGTAELAEINEGYRGLMALERGLDESTTFQIANSVWYRQTYAFRQTFIDQVKQTFDADVRASPFDATTIATVNAWVSEKTNGKIPTILESIEDDNVMFLINAIYFKGSWREQFDPAKTMDATFQSLTGPQTVRMMNRPKDFGTIRYASTSTATIGELIYGNGAFVMTILMPNSGSEIGALAAGLDTAAWTSFLAQLRDTKFQVALPKFTLSYERELKDDLIALGMRVPFEGAQANFSRMSAHVTPSQNLYISFVKHKTFVDVNEEGTEAAAVTNTGVSVTSLPPCLCVDRPFVFAIRERFSGTILFLGKMVRIP
jgi:serine protease inhibitor